MDDFLLYELKVAGSEIVVQVWEFLFGQHRILVTDKVTTTTNF